MHILIAGKNTALRKALKAFLQTRPGYVVVGTVTNTEALFIQVEIKKPDLLLLDEGFSEKLVEDVIVPLQQLSTCPKMIVMGARPVFKKSYLEAGAVAYIDKSDPPKSLLTAIEEIRLQGNHVQ